MVSFRWLCQEHFSSFFSSEEFMHWLALSSSWFSRWSLEISPHLELFTSSSLQRSVKVRKTSLDFQAFPDEKFWFHFFFRSVFYLLFRDTTEGGNCERISPNNTCGNDNMCSFKNFEAWMTMVHFTMGEFDVRLFSLSDRNLKEKKFVRSLVFSFRFNALRLSS